MALGPMIACLTTALCDISQEYYNIINGTDALLPGGYTCPPHSQFWQAALLVQGQLLCGAILFSPDGSPLQHTVCRTESLPAQACAGARGGRRAGGGWSPP